MDSLAHPSPNQALDCSRCVALILALSAAMQTVRTWSVRSGCRPTPLRLAIVTLSVLFIVAFSPAQS